MAYDLFVFKPGVWLGEGKIELNVVDEDLVFFTRWNVGVPDAEGNISCTQEIQVKGLSEIMMNQFCFSSISTNSFLVELDNHAVGKVDGTGIMDDKIIGWEFRVEDLGFEGFEFYEKEEDERYAMHAEYATNDQFRTIIRGKIWRQFQKKGEL